jgi:integrase
MFDELAQQYFGSAEEFAAALKLLQKCKTAEQNSANFEEFETNFLDNLDDVTGRESWLLNKAFEYEKAATINQPTTSQDLSGLTAEILSAIQNQPTAHLTSIPLEKAYDKFITDKKAGWKDENQERHFRQDIFALFDELIGDTDTAKLTKAHSVAYKDAVLKIPANRNKKKKYRNRGIAELLKMDIPEPDQFSNRNKAKYLQRLSSFLQWLAKEDYAQSGIHTPLQGVITKDTEESEERDQYKAQDLKKLFNSRHYTSGLHDLPFKFWVPLIALFTGARENEICQLHTTDVYKEEETGTWVFDINEDDRENTKKSIKKGVHARIIPIHKQLIEIGFLDFYEKVVKRKSKRLFPELPHRGKNKYADKCQRWFNNTYTNNRNCNINSPNTSFHSLRHTFSSRLDDEGVPDHHISMIVGHKPDGGVTVRRYIKKIELEKRNGYVQKLNFDDCIDFQKIKPWHLQKFNKNSSTSRRDM